jgi:hypothetical protein
LGDGSRHRASTGRVQVTRQRRRAHDVTMPVAAAFSYLNELVKSLKMYLNGFKNIKPFSFFVTKTIFIWINL